MKAFLLKEGQPEGIYHGIGIVKAGVPIIARTEAQAELLSQDDRFKAVQVKAEVAQEVPLTSAATVAPNAEAEAPAPAPKTARKGKE